MCLPFNSENQEQKTMSPTISSEDLYRIFKKLDKNGDGLICLQELKWLFDRVGVELTMEELESFLEKPSLDFDQFLFCYKSISKQNKGECEEEDVLGCLEEDDHEEDMEMICMAFKVFEMSDDDGFISCDGLENVLARLNEYDQRLQQSERQRKVEVQALKHQIMELENRFEDRFKTIMTEMHKRHVSS